MLCYAKITIWIIFQSEIFRSSYDFISNNLDQCAISLGVRSANHMPFRWNDDRCWLSYFLINFLMEQCKTTNAECLEMKTQPTSQQRNQFGQFHRHNLCLHFSYSFDHFTEELLLLLMHTLSSFVCHNFFVCACLQSFLSFYEKKTAQEKWQYVEVIIASTFNKLEHTTSKTYHFLYAFQFMPTEVLYYIIYRVCNIVRKDMK